MSEQELKHFETRWAEETRKRFEAEARAEAAESRCREMEKALGGLSMAMGNPALIFGDEGIEVALIRFAAERFRALKGEQP